MSELKPRPKRSLTLLDILAIVRELRSMLVNSFVDKVFRVDDSLLLRLRKEAEKLYLLITKHRIGLTRYISEDVRKSEPVLRRYLERERVVDIYNPSIDRIVHVKFSNDLVLIVEMIEPLNVVLVDSEWKVRWCLRRYESKDRKVAIGVKYTPPPRQFLNPLECSLEAYLANIAGSRSFIKTAARVLGVGVELVREACTLEEVKCDGEVEREHAVRVLYRIRELIKRALEGELQPVIYLRDEMPLTVLPFPFKSYDLLGCRASYYKSFNEAVDEYFRQLEIKELEERAIRGIETELQKLRRSIELTEQLLREYEEKAAELRTKAQKTLTYKYVLEELLDRARRLWAEHRDEFQTLVRDLELSPVKVVDFNPREKCLVLQIEDVTVTIPLYGKTIGEVIKDLFEKAKELERKIESARRALQDLRGKERELLERRSAEAEKIRRSHFKILYGVREWFERFKWFLTTSDHLVLAGKDASQNETLVRRYMRDYDLFFHADIPGAAAVILRLRGRDDRGTDSDIVQAAKYAAANSRAWVLGHTSIDVFFVRGEQVTKQAPAGEYLARGSFMIYGERSWIRGVELVLAIGVRVDEAQGEDKLVRIISAPPEAIERLCEYYVVLRPGHVDKNKVAKTLQDKFTLYVREKHGVAPRIPIEEIMTHVPGNSMIVEERESRGEVLSWDEIKAKTY